MSYLLFVLCLGALFGLVPWRHNRVTDYRIEKANGRQTITAVHLPVIKAKVPTHPKLKAL